MTPVQVIGGLLGFPYAIGLVVLGVIGSPLWTPAAAALVGMLLYHLVRPAVRLVYAQSDARGIALFVISSYAVQLAPAAIFYGIGRLIGAFI
jgi:hypothetical protein